MPVYQYNAIDGTGQLLCGEISADTPRRGRDILRNRGLTITTIAELAEKPTLRNLLKLRRRIAPGKITLFVRELASLLETGVTLAAALEILAGQYTSTLGRAIKQLHEKVTSGTALADAMDSLNERCFDSLDVSMVRVGQDTGELAASLNKLADFREKRQLFGDKVLSALLYPAIVGVAGIAVAIFLMTMVVPNLIEILDERGSQLPLATAVVKAVSDFTMQWWLLELLVPLIVAIAVMQLWQRPKTRVVMERAIFRLPLAGELLRKQHISQMAVVLGSLLRAGLTFIDAVAVTRQTLRCRLIADVLGKYRRAVEAGQDVSQPLAESGIFPAMVVQVFAVGQETGQLAEMLEQLADSYRRQVDTAAARLAAVLEPFIIIILAAGVGFLAFATILPIIEVSNVLQK